MAYWDLFREMENLQRQIDHAFKGIGGRRSADQTFMPGPEFKRSPRINLAGDGENFYVEALVPGVAPEELEMTVQNNTLTIGGERKSEHGEKSGVTWHRRERGAGNFLRTIELPVDIDPDKVTADYKDGILRVTMAKAEAAKPKRIEVKTS